MPIPLMEDRMIMIEHEPRKATCSSSFGEEPSQRRTRPVVPRLSPTALVPQIVGECREVQSGPCRVTSPVQRVSFEVRYAAEASASELLFRLRVFDGKILAADQPIRESRIEQSVGPSQRDRCPITPITPRCQQPITSRYACLFGQYSI